jgi:hypothetical protein
MIDRIHRYWRTHGTAALIWKVAHKLSRTRQLLKSKPGINKPTSAAQLCRDHFLEVTPARTYSLPCAQIRRVCIVTDSISSGSLFGGVATALILAAVLANKLGSHLRIVTRTERAQPGNVDHLLSLYGIKLEHDIQFKFAAFYDLKYELDVSESDLFLTTSWWTTAVMLPSVKSNQIIYLLQEDERMFYAFGDERLRCETILRNRDIRFLINTKLLFDYLIREGFDNLATKGTWFEPAFPPHVFHPLENNRDGKHKFLFYARPNNPRNLFYFGIEVIEHAIARNVLHLDDWDIVLVGKDIPAVTFGGDYSPTVYESLNWSQYAQLLGTVDLGLSLMYTPHPSYPPLDLAASGAVAVTNRFANKADLSGYSRNIICANLDRDALVEALREAVAIATDIRVRNQNYHNNGLLTGWEEAFGGIIHNLLAEMT